MAATSASEAPSPSDNAPLPQWHSPLQHELVHVGADRLSKPEGGLVVDTPVVNSQPSRKLIVSWNVAVDDPKVDGFEVHVRIGQTSASDGTHAGSDTDERTTTEYLFVGSFGAADLTPLGARDQSSVVGRVDVDEFVASAGATFDSAQVRLTMTSTRVVAHRVSLCFTHSAPRAVPTSDLAGPELSKSVSLDVPRYSQLEQAELCGRGKIKDHICSPTSVAMVMGFHGLPESTMDVVDRIFDPTASKFQFGNWPRSVQGAFSFGLRGFVARLNSWHDLVALVVSGFPVVISIKYAKGALRGALKDQTAGHLVVVVGFDEAGKRAIVNDPYGAASDQVRVQYSSEELARAWLGHQSVAYVLGQ